MRVFRASFASVFFALFAIAGAAVLAAGPVRAESLAFKQAIVEASADDLDLAEFYRAASYDAVWTGSGQKHLKKTRNADRDFIGSERSWSSVRQV